ncbi:SAM-dependent methyltransferase, partial [Streptomyces sp. NPDC058953]
MTPVAPRLTALARELLGRPFPLRIRAWDGSEAGPPGEPVLVVRHRRALRRLMWRPGALVHPPAQEYRERDVDCH